MGAGLCRRSLGSVIASRFGNEARLVRERRPDHSLTFAATTDHARATSWSIASSRNVGMEAHATRTGGPSRTNAKPETRNAKLPPVPARLHQLHLHARPHAFEAQEKRAQHARLDPDLSRRSRARDVR